MLMRDLRAVILTALLFTLNQAHFIQARICDARNADDDQPFARSWLLHQCPSAPLATRQGMRWQVRSRSGWPTAQNGWQYLMPRCSLDGRHGRNGGRARAVQARGSIAWYPIPQSWRCQRRDLSRHLLARLPIYSRQPMTIVTILGFQVEMFNVQRGHMSPHPYQGVWWQRPLMLRPISYLFESFGNSYRSAVGRQAGNLLGRPRLDRRIDGPLDG